MVALFKEIFKFLGASLALEDFEIVKFSKIVAFENGVGLYCRAGNNI